MSPVRVFIATTTGLVAVQRITEEDPEVSSVVCLAGKAVSLPISAAYEAFVRDPTGVIQRHFGHPAYRVDVSDTVAEGYSWQLALFCAHALVKADRLAHPDADAPLTVIATGEVNRDLHVLGVEHIDEKFGTLSTQLKAIDADPARTVLAVPRANADAARRHWADQTDLKVLAVDHAGELLDHIGTPLAAKPNQGDANTRPVGGTDENKSDGGRIIALIALIVLIGAGATAGSVAYNPDFWAFAAKWVPALNDETAKPQEESQEKSPIETAKLEIPGPEIKVPPPPQPEPEPIVLKTPPPPPSPVMPKPVPEPPPVAITPLPMPAASPEPPAPITQVPNTQTAEANQAITDIVESTRKKQSTDSIEVASRTPVPKNAVTLSVLEKRAPAGHSCMDVRAGRVEPITSAAPSKGPFAFGPSIMENLCTIDVQAEANRDGLYVFGRYQRWTERKPGKTPPDKVIDLGPRPGNVHWSVDIPENMGRGANFQIVVFSSWNQFNVPTRLLERIGTHPRSPEARRAVKRLKKRGIAMTSTRFRVIPEKRLKRIQKRNTGG